LALLDFIAAPAMPMTAATTASISHTLSQRKPAGWWDAIHAAANAVDPISMPPMPGTAVNEPARSMVSRIYRKLSMA
jgi:hypothetical protein